MNPQLIATLLDVWCEDTDGLDWTLGDLAEAAGLTPILGDDNEVDEEQTVDLIVDWIEDHEASASRIVTVGG